MNAKSELLDEHTREIAIANTKVEQIVKSLDALTKALWGVAGTTLATLLGFFIWFVQNK